MTDLTTMHLKCLLEKAAPGPWEAQDEYPDLDPHPGVYLMYDAAGDYLGIMHGQDSYLAAHAPELAQEVIRLREHIEGLITAMEDKAAIGASQSPAVIAGYLKEKVLGEPNEH